MKAAYEYYKQTAAKPARKTTAKITLGSLNSGAVARVTVKPRKAEKKPEFSAQEQALMKLIDSGAIGAFIAHHAPSVELD